MSDLETLMETKEIKNIVNSKQTKGKPLTEKISYFLRDYVAINLAANAFFQTGFAAIEYAWGFSQEECIGARIETATWGLALNYTYDKFRNVIPWITKKLGIDSEKHLGKIETITGFTYMAGFALAVYKIEGINDAKAVGATLTALATLGMAGRVYGKILDGVKTLFGVKPTLAQYAQAN